MILHDLAISLSKYQKVLYVSLFLLYILMIFIAWSHPYQNYERSIYSSTPTICWVLLFVVFILAIVIVLVPAFSDQKNHVGYGIGLILISLCSLFIVTISLIRSYDLSEVFGDSGTHLFHLLESESSGFLPLNTLYPARYCVSLFIRYITNIDIFRVFDSSYLIYFLLFVLGMILLSREICQHKIERLLVFILVCTLPLGSGMMLMGFSSYQGYIPYLAAAFHIPLLFYVITRSLKLYDLHYKKYLVLLFIMQFSILVNHVLAFILGVMFILSVILSRILARNLCKISSVFSILLVVFVVGLAWITINGWLRTPALSIANLLEGVSRSSHDTLLLSSGADIGSQLLSTNNFQTLFTIGVLIYAPLVLYGFSYVIGVLICIKKEYNPMYLSLVLLSIFVGLLWVLNLVSSLAFHSSRLFFMIIIVGVFGASITIKNLIDRGSSSKKYLKMSIYFFVVVIFTVSSLVGIFSFYPTYEINQHTTSHVTSSVLDSIEFIYVSGASSYELSTIDILDFRRFEFLQSSNMRPSISVNAGAYCSETHHFGYDRYESARYIVGEPTYLLIVLGIFDKFMYGMYHSINAKWTQNDFDHLSVDPASSKIYDNFDVVIFSIENTY